MPFLDVAEILVDPDFCQAVDVLRRAQDVNDYGEVGSTIARLSMIAVITSDSSNLSIGTDEQNMPRRIVVVTQFRLRGPAQVASGEAYLPDIVTWKGGQWEVDSVDDYSDYGIGFVQATCSSAKNLDFPPAYLPSPIPRMIFNEPRNAEMLACF